MKKPEQWLLQGISRVVIENVSPEVSGGRFPIKRTVGEGVTVTADIYADGHEALHAVVLYRPAREGVWREVAMKPLGRDKWQGEFRTEVQEPYVYSVKAWVDPFKSWSQDLEKKTAAGQDLSVEFLIGANLISSAASRAKGQAAKSLQAWTTQLKELGNSKPQEACELALSPELAALMEAHAEQARATIYEPELRVIVDRERARFSTWYEMFPRSCAAEAGRHGTFQNCIERLEYIAAMGFDVLYLPPIHPIGHTERKGKNNKRDASDKEIGSPWAIGSAHGGHKAVHPELGTLEDFKRLQAKAAERGIEIALDLAFQCSPDHPYVREHKEWFRLRPDGSVQYAENPPKKYQDIYPLHFENDHAAELCAELKSVVLYWIEQGVRIFRVDNPHTKPFAFWEWLIAEIRREHPDVIFLAEAFTRPNVMYRLAKLGFTQSYTYFAWRNTKRDLTEYFTALTRTDVREYFRPNLWPNTPDILTEYLQFGGRSAFMIRLFLAATLGASYGIYGPAFELCENRALEQGSEEYLDAEKFQIRAWGIDHPDSLKELIGKVNRIRREYPALQSDWSLSFHLVDNEQIIAYSKTSEDLADRILVVVNLDPHHTQSGWVQLPLDELQLDPRQSFQVHDLMTDARFIWQGPRNYVELDPRAVPAHIFRIRRWVRTEHDFDYFL